MWLSRQKPLVAEYGIHMLQDMNRVVIFVVTLGIFGAFLRAIPLRVMRLQRPLSFLFKRNKNKTKNYESLSSFKGKFRSITWEFPESAKTQEGK